MYEVVISQSGVDGNRTVGIWRIPEDTDEPTIWLNPPDPVLLAHLRRSLDELEVAAMEISGKGQNRQGRPTTKASRRAAKEARLEHLRVPKKG